MRLAPRALCRAAQAAWRENFSVLGRDVARWFPGHMAKGLKKMQNSLKLVDCIIEVHDARIPLSGRNPLFQETLGLKPHLLVLNKMDLADLTEQQKIMQRLEGEGLKNVVFTNCVKDESVQQIIPTVTELIESSHRYHRGENLEYCIMVIGVPNVGKSSLINSLRRQHLGKGKATRVGGQPGITRAVMSRIQVSERPLMFLLDTPGVLAPRIESVETGLKLALCGTVLDHLVGEETMADYLLYTLNRHQRFDTLNVSSHFLLASGFRRDVCCQIHQRSLIPIFAAFILPLVGFFVLDFERLIMIFLRIVLFGLNLFGDL
ncbi:mitochondrial ribosome-associated GTPase 1 isoform X2 [Saimiri boliviensis]|uniref:mitochondrial ribosome-associated GTPase 1 isoform X2 n=1 Tax=Saimiri boliviensis TaxID=27679 RepID=UPI003D788DBD